MKKLIEMTIDLDDPPLLTPAQDRELKRLAARPDAEIDLSDIPESDGANAVRWRNSPFYRPVKRSTTVRVDVDVLHWLKSKGAGYQTRLNAILREAMLRETR